jgi:cysteine-rich repeat protein
MHVALGDVPITLCTRVGCAVALAMALVAPVASHAEALLSRAEGGVAALPGVRGGARFALGRGALAALRAARGTARLDAFPLGGARTVSLELRRFAPVGPHTRVEVVDAGGPRAVAMPDAAYFTGRVAGEPESRALVVAAPDAVHGFVASGGDVFRFGPGADGVHRGYALGEVDAGAYPPPPAFCVNDAHPELTVASPAPARLAPPVAAAGLRVAQVAVETDGELRQKFGSEQAALAYLGELLAAASAIYERDVAVRLTFSYIRLWGSAAADPWGAADPGAALQEVRTHWLDPDNDMGDVAGPRDLVHFLSGKPVRGGVAYVNALCSQAYGFAVSQVFGAFDLASPSSIWDVMVLTHEMGHNFGSPHTHCYDPPIDRCYNAEPGCWDGAVVSSRGTIMSYCHLTGGLSRIDLLFGGTVAARIAPSVQAATCLTVAPAACGNGLLEAGEQCDDGNTANGDCCSASCALEPCPPTTTTSTTSTTTSRPPGTSSTSSSSSTAPRPASTTTTGTAPRPTTTTVPPPGDGDGDGVPDGADACPASAEHELVDATGCAVCPCDAMRDGTPWPSRWAYTKCVRAEIRRRTRLGETSRSTARLLARQTRLSTCGGADLTRCCVYPKSIDADGVCRVFRSRRCDVRRLRVARVADVGPGVCGDALCP